MRDIGLLGNRAHKNNIEMQNAQKLFLKYPIHFLSTVALLTNVLKNVGFDSSLSNQRVSYHVIISLSTNLYNYPTAFVLGSGNMLSVLNSKQICVPMQFNAAVANIF